MIWQGWWKDREDPTMRGELWVEFDEEEEYPYETEGWMSFTGLIRKGERRRLELIVERGFSSDERLFRGNLGRMGILFESRAASPQHQHGEYSTHSPETRGTYYLRPALHQKMPQSEVLAQSYVLH